MREPRGTPNGTTNVTWRWLVPKPRPATGSPQKTIFSMPNTISVRCTRTKRPHHRDGAAFLWGSRLAASVRSTGRAERIRHQLCDVNGLATGALLDLFPATETVGQNSRFGPCTPYQGQHGTL